MQHRRHFHQLFRFLRTTYRRTLRDSVRRDLRHGDNLLDKRRRVDLLHEFHHLSPHLRHQNIENLNRHEGLEDLLHGVPLDPRLWPHLNERCRPGGKHVPVVVKSKVHRACRPGSRSLLARGVGQLVTLLLIVGLLGAEWWLFSARAMATLIRSCRSHCLSRRCRLLVAPDALASRTDANMKSQLERNAKKQRSHTGRVVVVVVLLLLLCVVASLLLSKKLPRPNGSIHLKARPKKRLNCEVAKVGKESGAPLRLMTPTPA